MKDRISKGRVLIVDDEPNVRLVFRTALESFGFTVSEAQNGRAWAQPSIERSFRRGFLDLQMPGIGGMEVLQSLREAGSDVPVVVVTAHGSVPDAVAAMKLGAIRLSARTIDSGRTTTRVSDVIARHNLKPGHHPLNMCATGRTTSRGSRFHPSRSTSPRPSVRSIIRQFDLALKLLDERADLDPSLDRSPHPPGVVFETEGRHHSAYQSYKEALSIDPILHAGPAEHASAIAKNSASISRAMPSIRAANG